MTLLSILGGVMKRAGGMLFQPPQAAAPSAKIKILVVEDDTKRHDEWTRKLLQADVEVELVSSERQARKKIQEGEFDILVLNWNLYKGNGSAVLETWIDTQKGDEPSVVFSTDAGSELQAELLKTGAHNVLGKTGDNEIFTRLVARYIRQVRQEKMFNAVVGRMNEVEYRVYQLRLYLFGAIAIIFILFPLALIAYPGAGELIKDILT